MSVKNEENMDALREEVQALRKQIESLAKTAEKKASHHAAFLSANLEDEVEKYLANAIKKYPLISNLIVTDKTLAEDRIKVKTAGNLLNVYYKKLLSGN